jgi:hypothetical protein
MAQSIANRHRCCPGSRSSNAPPDVLDPPVQPPIASVTHLADALAAAGGRTAVFRPRRRARDAWTPSDEGSWPPKSLHGGRSPNCRRCGRRVETFVASQISKAEVDPTCRSGFQHEAGTGGGRSRQDGSTQAVVVGSSRQKLEQRHAPFRRSTPSAAPDAMPPAGAPPILIVDRNDRAGASST